MLDALGEANTAALIGLLGGLALGLAARIGRFCTLGAIEDALYSSDDRRLRMWAIALAVAIIGTHMAMQTGLLNAADTAYLGRVWNPLATVIGGLLFGYGMAMSGNCGYGALARLGGGDLRSLVIVIVMGLSAYVVMSGPLAHARIWLFPVDANPTGPQGFSLLANNLLGWQPVLTGLVFGGLLLALGLGSRAMLHSPGHVFWGCGCRVVGCIGLGRDGVDRQQRFRHRTGRDPYFRRPHWRYDLLRHDRIRQHPVVQCRVRHRRHCRGGFGIILQGTFPVGSLRRPARAPPPDRRRRNDGGRSRPGSGMQRRSGHLGLFSFGL